MKSKTLQRVMDRIKERNGQLDYGEVMGILCEVENAETEMIGLASAVTMAANEFRNECARLRACDEVDGPMYQNALRHQAFCCNAFNKANLIV